MIYYQRGYNQVGQDSELDALAGKKPWMYVFFFNLDVTCSSTYHIPLSPSFPIAQHAFNTFVLFLFHER